MIRINKDFVFEQTGENTFHLIRETYPRYAKLVNLSPNLIGEKDCSKISSDFINEESVELDRAEDLYGRDCFVEIMEGTTAEHFILFALTHNNIEWLSTLNDKEQKNYFSKLALFHDKDKGPYANKLDC